MDGIVQIQGYPLRMGVISHLGGSAAGEVLWSAKVGKGLQGRSPCRGMWGCPPQQSSPFSWPGEGGQGDEVDQVVDLTPIDWRAPLTGRLRSRMATPPFQFTGVDERSTPKSEQLPMNPDFRLIPVPCGIL